MALVLGILAVVAGGLWVGNRALMAKDALEQAQTELTTFKSALGQPNAPSTVQLYKQLHAHTAKAALEVDDPVWSFGEAVPFVGPNLTAFRQIAQMLNTLVVNGVQPVAYAANGVSVDSLKPKDGGLDIAPLKKLTPAIASLDTALRVADASAMGVDTKHTLSQIAAPVGTLHTTIQKVLPLTAELRRVMPLFYPALGGDGKRHYLLMFQNNAEERASGGNPAALAMLNVDDGKIKLGKQPSSTDFPSPYVTPPLTFKGDWNKLYGLHTSTYLQNITFTPDFPSSAKLVRAMWLKQYGGKVDGVISFDPVALSYLMRATGPVTLKNGQILNSDNAVTYLLSDVYARYPDQLVQNAVFASAAQAIFGAVTSGQGSPKDYLAQLTPMLAEQRLKFWSVRKKEQAALKTSQAWNMLPEDNSTATTVGVYNNDDATSKMSFYMDSTIKVKSSMCPAKKPTFTVTTKVTDTLKLSQVPGLSSYVLAAQPRIAVGGDRQWVQVYGPVGSKLISMSIDGKKVVWGTNVDYLLNTNYNATGVSDKKPAVRGEMYDRPVGIVSINMGPQQSRTVVAHFSGATDPSTTVAVSHTPKVRQVPVTITQNDCT
ncbi:DUF4012 domain-containing protein [uncultured Amnibacterium sp.]|uniref:DUF4012 domain-containing protein n=1 Tax=uncultured Amnibacterium sp. TaxID=1631851 RepID=UPI0035C9F197